MKCHQCQYCHGSNGCAWIQGLIRGRTFRLRWPNQVGSANQSENAVGELDRVVVTPTSVIADMSMPKARQVRAGAKR
jgi:hypothetical protein